MKKFRVCIFVLVCCGVLTNAQYEVPDAIVEAFTPRGLRVSIPDEEGIKLFALHAKINEEMNGREAGTFSRDITKAKDGRWTFYDSQARLKVGDILYFWTFVDYFDGERKLGYVKDDQSFTITELLPRPTGNTPNKVTQAPTVPPSTTSSPRPDVCEPSVTTVKGKSMCKGKLIFNGQFSRFVEEKDQFWTIQKKFAAAPDYEFVVYENNPKTLAVTDGRLVISPLLTDQIYGEGYVTEPVGLDLGEHCTGIRGSPECYQKPEGWYIISPVVSSQISSKGKFSFRYGKIEIRAKLPKGDWLYPELFLNSENEEYGPNYESGQIRIAFAAGNEQNYKKLEGGVILGPKPSARNYAIKSIDNTSPWGDEFHNFTVLWTPASITLSVDNSVYGTIFPPDGGFSSLGSNLQLKNANRWTTGSIMAPFDKEMHFVIGVGAGGHNFEDRSDGTKPWVNNKALSQKEFYKARSKWLPTWGDGAKLCIDYVKVWALKTPDPKEIN